VPRKQLELNPSKSFFYHVVAFVLRGLARLLSRPRVVGSENIPLTGPVMIAPTHRSNVDFAFSLFMTPRKVFFMAKDSLFPIPVVGRAITALGAFPVARGTADRDAMRAAQAVLAAGQALILFPEGTRKYGPTVDDLLDGAMFIAAREHAPVVPVGIAGTETFAANLKRGRLARVSMVIGAPIAPPEAAERVSRSAVSAKTVELQTRLQAALDEAQNN